MDIYDIRIIAAQQLDKQERGLPTDEFYRIDGEDILVLTTGGYIAYLRGELRSLWQEFLAQLEAEDEG
jgi:hypothetical protein